MPKKIITLVLSAALLATLAVPALAADTGTGASVDTQLAQVTQIVKKTLGISDSYKGFTGNLTDNNNTGYWELNWTGESDSVSVRADKNGKVMSYDHSLNNDNTVYNNYYSPAFPKVDQADALNAAKAFVKKVLGADETVTFNGNDSQCYTTNTVQYSFNGTVLLNGLKSPISFYVEVRMADMSIASYYRSDLNRQYASVPSAKPTVSTEKATELLTGTVKLQLEYIQSEDGKSATLQYVPVYNGDYYVNAGTGELVNLNVASDSIKRASATDLAMGETENAKLTEVEQTTVDSLKGVKSKTELDTTVRAVSELSIGSDYLLESSSYSMNKDTGEVLCQLRYDKVITDTNVIKNRFPTDYSNMQSSGSVYPIHIYKYVTVNAVTASIVSVQAYNSGSKETSNLSTAQLKSNAEMFLKKFFNAKYSLTAYNENLSNADSGNFEYSQTVNGAFFPTNSISITMSAYDGSVSNLYMNWTDNVKFESTDGIVSATNAKLVYLGCYKTVLQYVYLTTDQSGLLPVTSNKILPNSENYTLVLAYKSDSDSSVSGINAKTGKPIIDTNNQASVSLTYNDIDGCYGKAQIGRLAKYDIGFTGGSFKPTIQLTQRDALILLLSAVGYTTATDDELYNDAYQNNLLTKSEKNADKILTRAEFVKMLVGATEYGAAGELKGVFYTGFSDDSSISGKYYGYVAIAKSLGIAHGDENNGFNPNGTVSRQDAAIMLYNFMSR